MRYRNSFRQFSEVVLIRTFTTVAPVLYVSLSTATFSLLDCSKLPDGKYHLDADLSLLCFTSRWWSVFPLCIFGLVIYVLGVPSLVVFVLVRNRHRLHTDLTSILRYGTLYNHLRRSRYYNEVILLGKRVATVFVVTFFSANPIWRFGLLTALFAIVSALQHRLSPTASLRTTHLSKA